MREIRRSALVAAPPQQVFEIINDVERYPEFVPGCTAAAVLDRGEASLRARLTVGNGAFSTSFVTRNQLEPPNIIRMQLDEGPFRTLEGFWQLTPIALPGSDAPSGCRVDLQLRFEPKGGLAGLAAGPLVERLAGSLVDAFVARAAGGQSPGRGG